MVQTIILARQARDKHRENSKKEWRFPIVRNGRHAARGAALALWHRILRYATAGHAAGPAEVRPVSLVLRLHELDNRRQLHGGAF